MLEPKKTIRLNNLFEKVVSDKANIIERRELNALYQEYINDGRDGTRSVSTSIQHVTS